MKYHLPVFLLLMIAVGEYYLYRNSGWNAEAGTHSVMERQSESARPDREETLEENLPCE